MSKINTAEIREEYRTRHKDREWFEVWLQEALDEVDRLTTIQNSLALSIETRTKEACKENLKAKAVELDEDDSWTGPSLALDVAFQAIDSAEVNKEIKSSV